MPFRDRSQAGRKLAERFQSMSLTDNPLGVALPRGGVPIGFEISRALDLPLEVLVVRKTRELIDEHQRVLRRNLELLAACLARDLVVEPEEVVAKLGKFRAIALVGPRRRLVLLGASNPPNAVLAGTPALRALVPSLSGFRFLAKEGAFVEGHPLILATNANAFPEGPWPALYGLFLRPRIEPLRSFLGQIDSRVVPQEAALASKDGPYLFLPRHLLDDREQLGREYLVRLLSKRLYF